MFKVFPMYKCATQQELNSSTTAKYKKLNTQFIQHDLRH